MFVYEFLRHAGQSPGIPSVGHSQTDLTDKLVLFWPANSFLIVYNPARKQVGIVRVIHGARDIPGLL